MVTWLNVKVIIGTSEDKAIGRRSYCREDRPVSSSTVNLHGSVGGNMMKEVSSMFIAPPKRGTRNMTTLDLIPWKCKGCKGGVDIADGSGGTAENSGTTAGPGFSHLQYTVEHVR